CKTTAGKSSLSFKSHRSNTPPKDESTYGRINTTSPGCNLSPLPDGVEAKTRNPPSGDTTRRTGF
ncbi:MAG: hypothetical protein SGJ03_01010, partial [Alphaproteobacteria bacterium]|nr:hypothetical protein [Alphaproteobacteria bacterium]